MASTFYCTEIFLPICTVCFNYFLKTNEGHPAKCQYQDWCFGKKRVGWQSITGEGPWVDHMTSVSDLIPFLFSFSKYTWTGPLLSGFTWSNGSQSIVPDQQISKTKELVRNVGSQVPLWIIISRGGIQQFVFKWTSQVILRNITVWELLT